MLISGNVWLYLGVPHAHERFLRCRACDEWGWVLSDFLSLDRSQLSAIGILPLGGTLHALRFVFRTPRHEKPHSASVLGERILRVHWSRENDGEVIASFANGIRRFVCRPLKWLPKCWDLLNLLPGKDGYLHVQHLDVSKTPELVARRIEEFRGLMKVSDARLAASKKERGNA